MVLRVFGHISFSRNSSVVWIFLKFCRQVLQVYVVRHWQTLLCKQYFRTTLSVSDLPTTFENMHGDLCNCSHDTEQQDADILWTVGHMSSKQPQYTSYFLADVAVPPSSQQFPANGKHFRPAAHPAWMSAPEFRIESPVWVSHSSYPLILQVSYAVESGLSPKMASILVMLLGFFTASGRILFGKVIEWGFLNRLNMHQISMVLTGTAAMLLPLIKGFGGLVAYVIFVGLVDGCYVVLLPVLTSTLIGSGNDSVLAWGYLTMVCSITYTLGPPVAGKSVQKRQRKFDSKELLF